MAGQGEATCSLHTDIVHVYIIHVCTYTLHGTKSIANSPPYFRKNISMQLNINKALYSFSLKVVNIIDILFNKVTQTHG
jgi:hypothetical protein